MFKYTVLLLEGDYRDRQEAANAAGCICYFEQHCNSREYKFEDPGTEDNPIMAIVANNAGETSVAWGYSYCENVFTEIKGAFPIFKGHTEVENRNTTIGVLRRRYKNRGDFNLRFTDMPAILGEPLWLSDKNTVEAILEGNIINRVARGTVKSIIESFPAGGIVGLSCGHIGKDSQPFDTGAPVRGYPMSSEGLISKLLIDKIAAGLEAHEHNPVVGTSNNFEHYCECPHCNNRVRLVRG